MKITPELNLLMDQYIAGWRELVQSPFPIPRAEIEEEIGYADKFRDPDMEELPEGEPDYTCANFWHNYTSESFLMSIFENGVELDQPSLEMIGEYGTKIIQLLRLKDQILILRDGRAENAQLHREIQEAEHRIIFKMGQWMLQHYSAG